MIQISAVLEPIEYTGADVVIDAFLEQHTVLVFKYDLRYLEDFERMYQVSAADVTLFSRLSLEFPPDFHARSLSLETKSTQ